jgi:hypothetical protein
MWQRGEVVERIALIPKHLSQLSIANPGIDGDCAANWVDSNSLNERSGYYVNTLRISD